VLFVRAPLRRSVLAGRVSVLVVTLLGATAIVFVIVQSYPEIRAIHDGTAGGSRAVAATRHQLGLDIAPAQRYFR